jgi:hypothetical protein
LQEATDLAANFLPQFVRLWSRSLFAVRLQAVDVSPSVDQVLFDCAALLADPYLIAELPRAATMSLSLLGMGASRQPPR